MHSSRRFCGHWVGRLWSRGSKVCKITVTAVPRIMVVCFAAALSQGMFMRAAVLSWDVIGLSSSACVNGRFGVET